MLNISLKAEDIFHIGSFAVTNATLMAFIVLIVLTILAITLRNTLKTVPGILQNLAEIVLEGALGLMDSVLGGPGRRRRSICRSSLRSFFLYCSQTGSGSCRASDR